MSLQAAKEALAALKELCDQHGIAMVAAIADDNGIRTSASKHFHSDKVPLLLGSIANDTALTFGKPFDFVLATIADGADRLGKDFKNAGNPPLSGGGKHDG